MKISDSILNSTLLITPSLRLKTNKSTKPFKFNRRLKNRMNTLSKNLSTSKITNHMSQMITASSLRTNTQLTQPNTTARTPSLINQQPPTASNVSSSYKPFTTPRITTTLIPLNICPTECCQIDKSTLVRSVNIMEDYHEQKSTSTVTTHLIGDWIIRESSEPFQRKENERMMNLEEKVKADELIRPNLSSLPSNVKQWTTDDVCLFFERVLGKNCFASLINEHMIDGTALLLLQDEHLSSIFKMQLGPRLKLFNRINQLKNGDSPITL